MWLHQGCDSDLSTDFPNFGASNARASKMIFFRFGVEIGFGAAIPDAAARSSIVFCNSLCAGRVVLAVSRLLGAAAACVRLFSFAAGPRKSYWCGCIKAATVICQQIFSILALAIFLFKAFLKVLIQNGIFSLWRRDPVLELQFPTLLCVVLLCFAIQCLQVAL